MMLETLTLLLRIAGAGMLALAALHLPIGRYLRWREECARLSPANAAVFRVHTLFICLVLVMMGLPALFDPGIFLAPSRAGAWLAWSFAVFWAVRLGCQWFVYPPALWRGKQLETVVHWCFTVAWMALAGLFTACGLWQAGWRP
jgi:hypothetical protein